MVKYFHSSVQFYVHWNAASKTALADGKDRRKEDISSGETLQLMSHLHVVTTYDIIQKFLNGHWRCLSTQQNWALCPREGSSAALWCFLWVPTGDQSAQPPKEACFAISPIKYIEILSSATRQKGHLCNSAIFNLLFFSDCSVDLKFTWNGRNRIAIS